MDNGWVGVYLTHSTWALSQLELSVRPTRGIRVEQCSLSLDYHVSEMISWQSNWSNLLVSREWAEKCSTNPRQTHRITIVRFYGRLLPFSYPTKDFKPFLRWSRSASVINNQNLIIVLTKPMAQGFTPSMLPVSSTTTQPCSHSCLQVNKTGLIVFLPIEPW